MGGGAINERGRDVEDPWRGAPPGCRTVGAALWLGSLQRGGGLASVPIVQLRHSAHARPTPPAAALPGTGVVSTHPSLLSDDN
jgi:hypothetical protein